MTNFINSKNKLKKIFEQILDNKTQLKKKSNDSLNNSLSSFIKIPIEIYNTGWIIAVESGGIIGG